MEFQITTDFDHSCHLHLVHVIHTYCTDLASTAVSICMVACMGASASCTHLFTVAFQPHLNDDFKLSLNVCHLSSIAHIPLQNHIIYTCHIHEMTTSCEDCVIYTHMQDTSVHMQIRTVTVHSCTGVDQNFILLH